MKVFLLFYHSMRRVSVSRPDDYVYFLPNTIIFGSILQIYFHWLCMPFSFFSQLHVTGLPRLSYSQYYRLFLSVLWFLIPLGFIKNKPLIFFEKNHKISTELLYFFSNHILNIKLLIFFLVGDVGNTMPTSIGYMKMMKQRWNAEGWSSIEHEVIQRW